MSVDTGTQTVDATKLAEFRIPAKGYPDLKGSEEPRLWTRPLRPLTPETTLGFQAVAFAERVLGVTLFPWQRWWLIHALELREDNTLRFRIVLTLISRQNGKTFLLKVLALYFLYVLRVELVLGTAQKLDIARESWSASYALAAVVPDLAAEFTPPARRDLKPGRRDANGAEEITLTPNAGSIDPRRYRVTASTEGAGRGLSVNLLIMDELRQQRDNKAWAALSKTTIAQLVGMIVAITNAGDDESVVLNTLRASALAGTDDAIMIAEWSGEDGCALDDPDQLAQANPSLGHPRGITFQALRLAMATDSPEVFRTECLCQHVRALDVLVSPEAWKQCSDAQLTLDPYRSRVVACLEIAPDSGHATLVAAARDDHGRVMLDVVKSWNDVTKLWKGDNLAGDGSLTWWLAKVKPRQFGWFPNGPAAAEAALLRGIKGSYEIKGAEVTESCMGLVGLIHKASIRQNNDPLLTAHVLGARKFDVADGYRFVRKGTGHVDGAYAAAGAARMAQSQSTSDDHGVWVV